MVNQFCAQLIEKLRIYNGLQVSVSRSDLEAECHIKWEAIHHKFPLGDIRENSSLLSTDRVYSIANQMEMAISWHLLCEIEDKFRDTFLNGLAEFEGIEIVFAVVMLTLEIQFFWNGFIYRCPQIFLLHGANGDCPELANSVLSIIHDVRTDFYNRSRFPSATATAVTDGPQ